MNTTAWRLLPVAAATIVALLLVRVASFVPLRDARAEHAWVRLSWSARPERIEQCRRLTDAELAERPEHMRLRLECEGRFARYLLQLTVDGVITLADTIQGDGLRHDRPMHVLREASLAPGTRAVRATLTRVDTLPASNVESEREVAAQSDSVLGEREGRERDERQRREGEGIPARLSFDTTVTLRAGRVLLITYDGTRRALVALAGGN
ncbi:MAG: hypothetical protein IPK33_20060 [Gemmatimonadetes bacterium]|nr:hypothetical protein [Gemmatimonadota bacterium]